MLTDFQELWLTNRKGTLPKLNELESINVVKTCERLRLAITQPRNDLQRTLDVTRRQRTEELTFRNASYLCYTTLRVHELQVNDLLNRSAALVAQSRDWSMQKARKRSKQSATFGSKRKRMQDATIPNYTQLLDDTENFVEWSKTAEVVKKKGTKANNHCRTTCIHIREITINEFDLNAERYSMDEDEGFGNATADEISKFLQLLSDAPAAPLMEAKTLKRKAADVSKICEKKAKMCNGSEKEMTCGSIEYPEVETVRCLEVEAVGNDGINSHFIPATQKCPNNSTFINESPKSFEISCTPMTEINNIDETNWESCEVINNISFDKATETNMPPEQGATAKIQHNGMNTICNHVQPSKSANLKKSKSKQTIIDESTELTHTEIRLQLQAQINIRSRLRKMRARIKWSKKRYGINIGKSFEKILPTANELLTTLNRSCITTRKFKIKHQATHKSSETAVVCSAYRNLLREILNREISDDLATEVYKNWNKIEKNNSKNSPQRFPTPEPENITCVQEEFECNQLFQDNPMAFNNNNNNLNYVTANRSPSNVEDEWGAFDVMVKLLNLWRSKNVLGDVIPLSYLLQPAKIARKQAAKGFAALLELAASGFIVLLSGKHSAQLQHIKLGPASAKLIQRSEPNGMSLRRVNNGYRIHAS